MASVFWHAHSILFIGYLEKGKTINSNYYMALLDRLGAEIKKTASHAEEKSVVPPRQCTVPQVHENDGQIEWIKLRIASSPTIFSRSAPLTLLTVCWSEKNAPGKEIGLQWRSDYWNWGLFLEQGWIILQKRHQKVREALEWMYYASRKLCWWIKSNLTRPTNQGTSQKCKVLFMVWSTRGVSWNLPVLLIDVARDMYTFLWFGIYVIFFYGQ